MTYKEEKRDLFSIDSLGTQIKSAQLYLSFTDKKISNIKIMEWTQ